MNMYGGGSTMSEFGSDPHMANQQIRQDLFGSGAQNSFGGRPSAQYGGAQYSDAQYNGNLQSGQAVMPLNANPGAYASNSFGNFAGSAPMQQYASNAQAVPSPMSQNYRAQGQGYAGYQGTAGNTLADYGSNAQMVQQHFQQDLGYAGAGRGGSFGAPTSSQFAQFGTNQEVVQNQMRQDAAFQSAASSQYSQQPTYAGAMLSQFGPSPAQNSTLQNYGYGQPAQTTNSYGTGSYATNQSGAGQSALSQYGTNPQAVQSHIRQDDGYAGYRPF